jgi:hypothetical protein
MKPLASFVFLLGVALLISAIPIAPVQAQATRTWVSGVGDDANPCSRIAPCKTFAGAISKTLAGGEIDCLDPGGFGAVTITKSITIDCGAGQVGSILAAGPNGINVSAAATDTVRLRNLSIQGIGSGSTGILATTMRALYIENVVIAGFRAGNGAGIRFQPNNASAKLFVTDSIMDNNGIGTATGGGIVVVPGTGSASVQIVNTRLVDNSVGLNLFSAGGILVALQDGLIATNAGNGITAAAIQALNLTISGAQIVNNFGNGIAASGAAGTVRIGGTTITGNAVGVSSSGGAALQSFKNNQIAGNNIDGTPIPAFLGPGGTALQ